MDDGDKIIIILGFFGFLSVITLTFFAYFKSQPTIALSQSPPVASAPVYRYITKDNLERARQELRNL